MPQIRGSTRASLIDFWHHARDTNPDDNNSCWEWCGAFDGNGYPMYCGVSARRIVALIDTGAIPGNVSMDCGNPRCINPLHFYKIGTPGRKCSKTGKIPARHDIELQREIYRLRHLTNEELGKRYTVSPGMVVSLRLHVPLYAIEAEILWCKANKRTIIRHPLSGAIEFNEKG